MKDFTVNFGQAKEIVLELSEDGTYYNGKFYNDFVTSDGTYPGWIECKVTTDSCNHVLKVRDYKEDNKIFSIIVSDEEQPHV